MKHPTALFLLLSASLPGGCGTFLLPHPNPAPVDRAWTYVNETGSQDSSAHVPPGFRDPPMPKPPPPPPQE